MKAKKRGLCRLLFAALLAVGGLHLAATPSLAGCDQDGVVDMGEECDGVNGTALFIDGDPAKDSCTTGSRCYFQFTCCKFNCQFVGTPGVPCQDGDSCSGPDTCDQVGVCNGGPAVVDGTPCDDGLFCTGVESCENGRCTSSDGDPCPGTACNVCQEDTDSCFNPAGSSCADGSGCVTGGTCDGAGTCTGGTFADGAPCDDGLYCNGTDDSCQGGTCSVHTGSPCVGSDGDANCQESCDEATDSCNAPDAEGSSCDDTLFCNGDADECVDGACVGSGTAACDDGNSCTEDSCDEGTQECVSSLLPDGTACADGEICTVDDVCTAGVCTGDPALLEDLCPWTVVLRENAKKDTIRTNIKVEFDGDTCGGSVKFAGETTIYDDLVADEAVGELQVRLAPDAIIGGDIVSSGGGARAFPGSEILPYLAVSALAPGALAAKDDMSGSYDLTGTHPLATQCHDARTSYPTAVAAVEAFGATQTLPAVSVALGDTFTITANQPGNLNVIDIEGKVKVSKDAILELNGAGDPATVVILRVAGKFQLLLSSQLALTGGLTPDRVLIYSKGKKCQVGDLAFGGGTLLCTPGRIKTGRTVAWVGAMFSDGKLMKVGEKTNVLYQPFVGF